MEWWRGPLKFLGLDRSLEDVDARAPAELDSSSYVRGASWRDVLNVAALLDKYEVDYTLLGGYALNFNGLVRQTGDVDILVANNPENNRRWISALSELPDGAAKELIGEEGDPFPKDDWDDDPGVLRIADEILIDVMPKACGLDLDDLRKHVHRVHHDGVSLNVLDLHGLRKTKQGVRSKDVADLHHIDMTLSALGTAHALSTSGMTRRKLVAEPNPTSNQISFTPPPAPTEDEIEEATRLIDMVRSQGGIADIEPTEILQACDLSRILSLQARAGMVRDLSEVLDGREPDPAAPSPRP